MKGKGQAGGLGSPGSFGTFEGFSSRDYIDLQHKEIGGSSESARIMIQVSTYLFRGGSQHAQSARRGSHVHFGIREPHADERSAALIRGITQDFGSRCTETSEGHDMSWSKGLWQTQNFRLQVPQGGLSRGGAGSSCSLPESSMEVAFLEAEVLAPGSGMDLGPTADIAIG